MELISVELQNEYNVIIKNRINISAQIRKLSFINSCLTYLENSRKHSSTAAVPTSTTTPVEHYF